MKTVGIISLAARPVSLWARHGPRAARPAHAVVITTVIQGH